MSINGEKEIELGKTGDSVDPKDVKINDPELWGKIERSDSMERVNESQFRHPRKRGPRWKDECSDCDSDLESEHCFGVYGCRLCVTNVILMPISFGFLYYYTWRNPDESECWVISGGDVAYSEEQGLPDEHDIASLWHTWFFLGVILTAAYFAWSLFHLIIYLWKGTPHMGTPYHDDKNLCDACLQCLRCPV